MSLAMKLGIFAKTFLRPTVQECFDAVVALGLRTVQFNFACAGLPTLPDELSAAKVDQIRQAAEARQISIEAVSGTYNMIHPNRRVRSAELRRLSVAAWGCNRLGGSLLTLCTGTRDPNNMWQHHADNASPAAWKDLLAAMHDAVRFADEFNVNLGIEPEPGNVVDSPFKARRLLDEFKSPRLKIVIDPANLLRPPDIPRQRDVLDQAFALLESDIGLAHAKELGSDGQAGDVAIGNGVIDWGHYLSLLNQVKFSGPVVMHGFTESASKSSVGFLQTVAKKAQILL